MILGGDARLAQRLSSVLPEARLVVRRAKSQSVNLVVVDDYAQLTDRVFAEIDTVVNCVGCVDGDLATLDRINVTTATETARRARAVGCRNFIQISSLSVHGHATQIDHSTPVQPVSAYGRSKAAAEAALRDIASADFSVTLVRAPALYGVGALGKFGRLARFMRLTGQFPIPAVHPQRSVLHLDNAAAVVARLSREPRSEDVVFAADHDAFDVGILANAVTAVSGRAVRLRRAPPWAFDVVERLAPGLSASLYANSLIASASAVTSDMTLPVSLSDGLAAMLAAAWQTR